MPELKATFTGDNSQLLRQIQTSKVALNSLGGAQEKWWNTLTARGSQHMAAQAAAQSAARKQMMVGISAEVLGGNVVGPRMAAGAKTNMRVAATMFVSALRDSLASLASGANPLTVFAQQAPQIGQAFVMMGMAGVKALLRFVPVVGTLIAGIAVAISVTGRLRKAWEAVAAMTDPFEKMRPGIEAVRNALDKATISLDAFLSKLKMAGTVENPIKGKLDTDLEREKRNLEDRKKLAELRRQIALASGNKSGAEAESQAMRVDEEQTEQRILKLREKAVEKAKVEAQATADEAISANTIAGKRQGDVEQAKALISHKEEQLKAMEEWEKKFGGQDDALSKATRAENQTNMKIARNQLEDLKDDAAKAERASASAERDSAEKEQKAIQMQTFVKEQEREIAKQKEENARAPAQREAEALMQRRLDASKADTVKLSSEQSHGLFGPGEYMLADIGKQQLVKLDQLIAATRANKRGVTFGG